MVLVYQKSLPCVSRLTERCDFRSMLIHDSHVAKTLFLNEKMSLYLPFDVYVVTTACVRPAIIALVCDCMLQF